MLSYQPSDNTYLKDYLEAQVKTAANTVSYGGDDNAFSSLVELASQPINEQKRKNGKQGSTHKPRSISKKTP